MAAVVSIRNLSDYQVLNPLGESLGEVRDVVFESDLSRARYFVLSFSSSPVAGDKLFAVPVDAVRLDTENECLILDVEHEDLQNAPGFDERRPPEGPDREIERAIYRFDETHLPAATRR